MEQDVKRLMSEIDSNNDGTISFDEFVNLMRKIKTGQVTVGISIFSQILADSKAAILLGTIHPLPDSHGGPSS
eukprot:scaffold489_cov259-Pinguiococcus_pyrenoidosus.AAC.16